MNENDRIFKTLPLPVVYTFFTIGIFSALCFRLIILFQYYDAAYVRITWYIGIIGYLFFFFYRYLVSRKRKRIIKSYRLIEKLESGKTLDETEKKAVIYILSSINVSLENYNYNIIFLLSLFAIIFDLVLSYTLK
jgi:hypothetical protein